MIRKFKKSKWQKMMILIKNSQKAEKIKCLILFIYNHTCLQDKIQIENSMASSYGICTTGTKRKAQKINIYFDDKIKTNKITKMSLFPWIRIDELKKQLALTKFQNHIAWNDIRLFYKNLELLPEHRRFFDFGVEPDSIILIKNVEVGSDIERGIVNPYHIFDVTPNNIKNLIIEVQSGLNNGKRPKLADDGTSGTYFLENHLKKIVAIFKPYDQEPFAHNNPRNMVGPTGSPGIRKGILSGESATRQVAAFLLDQQHFHSVPQTTYIQFFHPTFIQKQQMPCPIASDRQQKLNRDFQLKTKNGSLQAFVESQDIAANLGSNQFGVEQVHKIGILDLRILNCDRNDANILVKKVMVGKEKPKKIIRLIPIDHGLSFPDNFAIYDYEMVWMGYRQAQQPFSQKSLKFIESIDPIKDCKKLREKLGFRQICLRNFRIAETFLKKTAKQGFNLYEIGSMMYRKQRDESDDEEQNENKNKEEQEKSELQKLVANAENIYHMIKQNGMKSTVNFQIMFTKPKKLQESLPDLSKNQLEVINKKQQHKQTSLEKETKQKQNHEKTPHTFLHRPNSSPNKTRNVSLPNLKLNKKESKNFKQKRKIRKQQEVEDRRFIKKKKEEEWDEIFFHYFEEFLERFIQEKKKKHRVVPSRQRLMSQNIDYQY